MSEPSPQVGQTVQFFPAPRDSGALGNGQRHGDPVAAIVTRVWQDDYVNLAVFADTDPPVARTSVHHQSLAHDHEAFWLEIPEQ